MARGVIATETPRPQLWESRRRKGLRNVSGFAKRKKKRKKTPPKNCFLPSRPVGRLWNSASVVQPDFVQGRAPVHTCVQERRAQLE